MCLSVKEVFPSIKKKTHNFCLCGWEAHTSIFLISLFSFLFFGFFPAREKGQILFTHNQPTKQTNSIIYCPTVRWSLQRTMNSFSKRISKEEPSIHSLHKVPRLQPHARTAAPACESPHRPTGSLRVQGAPCIQGGTLHANTAAGVCKQCWSTPITGNAFHPEEFISKVSR